MSIFPKVIDEGKGDEFELKSTLEDKIRRQQMVEMDEVTLETATQAQRTKRAELEGREAVAGQRKTEAEIAIAEKAVPQGVWGFMGELLKDRNPQAPMTVQDMLAVIDRVQTQGSQGSQEQPQEGIYGVLTALITQMGQNNKQITPIELIQAIQSMNPSTAQGSQGSQLTDMLTNFALMKNLFAPPAPVVSPEPGLTVQPTDSQGRPMGGAINMPIPLLTDLWKTNQEMRQSQERHEQHIGIMESLRKEFPRILSAAERQLGKGGPPEGKPPKQRGGQGQEQPTEMPMIQCPHCSLQFGVPPGMKNVLCPSPDCPSNQQRAEPPEETLPEGARG